MLVAQIRLDGPLPPTGCRDRGLVGFFLRGRKFERSLKFMGSNVFLGC